MRRSYRSGIVFVGRDVEEGQVQEGRSGSDRFSSLLLLESLPRNEGESFVEVSIVWKGFEAKMGTKDEATKQERRETKTD